MDVADVIIKMYNCEKLAVHLEIPLCSKFVEVLLQKNPSLLPNEVALAVMKKSLSECGRTVFCQQLRSALSAVAGWKGLLEKFNEVVGCS